MICLVHEIIFGKAIVFCNIVLFAFYFSSCKRCKTLCEKQRDIEDVSKYECTSPSNSSNIQASPCSSLREEQQSDSIASGFRANSSRYNVISPVEDMNESQFDELKDIEDLTLREYFQGDSHQLTRHVILILFLCLFSILVSYFLNRSFRLFL